MFSKCLSHVGVCNINLPKIALLPPSSRMDFPNLSCTIIPILCPALRGGRSNVGDGLVHVTQFNSNRQDSPNQK